MKYKGIWAGDKLSIILSGESIQQDLIDRFRISMNMSQSNPTYPMGDNKVSPVLEVAEVGCIIPDYRCTRITEQFLRPDMKCRLQEIFLITIIPKASMECKQAILSVWLQSHRNMVTMQLQQELAWVIMKTTEISTWAPP